MKVVFVLSRLGAGGAPIQVVTLAREMRRMGHTTLLVTGPHDPRHDGDMSYLLQPGDEVRWIPEMTRSLYPWKDAAALWRLWRVIRAVRPSVVHTHTAKAGLLGRIAARLAGAPVVVHTFHGNVFNGYFPAPMAWAVKRLERCLARLSSSICVLSRQQAAEIGSCLGANARSKIRIVPLGLELQEFFRLQHSPPRDEPFTVGWLGRFAPIKDLPLLVSVIEETLRTTDRVSFLIAGDGPQRRIVESAAARFGPARVDWVGWQRDVAPFIAKCHVLIQTSRNEGTPISLIQGMAAGRPFISTAAGGIVDMVLEPVVRPAGGCRWFQNGILAEPEPKAFATAIRELACSRERLDRMGQAAFQFAVTHYGLARLIENVNSLYTDLLRAKTQAGKISVSTVTLPAPEPR